MKIVTLVFLLLIFTGCVSFEQPVMTCDDGDASVSETPSDSIAGVSDSRVERVKKPFASSPCTGGGSTSNNSFKPKPLRGSA